MFRFMQDTKIAETNFSGPGAGHPLTLTVNGETRQSSSDTLLALLADLGYGADRVATAVNGDFVPERLRAERRLAAGDCVEIVAPRQGG